MSWNINFCSIEAKIFDDSKWFSNIFGENFNLGIVLICMIAYSLMYLLIAWYLECIMYNEYGSAFKPFYFLKKVE
jgi:hypothetical protein